MPDREELRLKWGKCLMVYLCVSDAPCVCVTPLGS